MFKRDDFKDMEHNPFACRAGEMMTDKYPELARHEVFTRVPSSEWLDSKYLPQREDLDMLLRFTVLFVQWHRNPIAAEKDFDKRAELVWETLGVKKRADTLRFFVEENHRWWRAVLFEYFKVVNNDLYNLWFSLKMNFANNMAVLRHELPASADEKFVNALQKIKSQSQGDLAEIQKIELRLFGDEKLRDTITKESVATEGHAEIFAEDFPT